jgi:hypothetical protein
VNPVSIEGIGFDTFVGIVGFAVALAGLVLGLKQGEGGRRTPSDPNRSRRGTVQVGAVIVAAVLGLTSVRILYQHAVLARRVDRASSAIIKEVGTDTRTADELLRNLPEIERPTFDEALERLLETGSLDKKLLRLRDDSGIDHVAWGYYATVPDEEPHER